MKKNVLIKLCLILSTIVSTFSYSQAKRPELGIGNYVVVGAYSLGNEYYLDFYMKSLSDQGVVTKSGFDSKRQFYYIYLDVYQDFMESYRQMKTARQNSILANAWIRVVKDVNTPITIPLKTAAIPIPVKQDVPTKAIIPVEKPQPEKSPVIEPEVNPGAETIVPVDNPKPAPVFLPVTLKNVEVFISIYDAQKDNVIQGDIEVIDTKRSRLLEKIKGNEYLNLSSSQTDLTALTLICNVFGYRKSQLEISYPIPTEEQAELVGDFYLVKFNMVRYQKGDISILSNVYFYNDAAIMLPTSKYELNKLLDMMKENESMKIILHGHTNGNAHGKIITMGPTKDFFSITKDVKTSNGSSRELSEQRAGIIREWLIANGILPERVSIQEWGGKKMLYDKHGVNAKKNIRVEVEVVED